MLKDEGVEVLSFVHGQRSGHYKAKLRDPVSGKEFTAPFAFTPSDRRDDQNNRSNIRQRLKELRA